MADEIKNSPIDTPPIVEAQPEPIIVSDTPKGEESTVQPKEEPVSLREEIQKAHDEAKEIEKLNAEFHERYQNIIKKANK